MRIALIGFMGAGKSTVGRLLGRILELPFLDLDDVVVREAGMPIAEVFRSRGEEAFRSLESAALARIADDPSPAIVAAGGGAPLRPANRALLRERFRTFYLDAPFAALASRTAGDSSRPLRSASLDELEALFRSRLPVYEEVGERVDTSGLAPEEVADLIAARLARRAPGSP